MNDAQDLQVAEEHMEELTGENTEEQKEPLTNFEIDTRGFLVIYRNGHRRIIFCPFASKDMTIHCGDWCPLFGDVVRFDDGTAALQFFCASTRHVMHGHLEDQRND